EGVAIVQYLADRVPDRGLIPAAGTLSRYHAIEWLNYIATELHKGFSPLFNPKTPEEYKTFTREKLEKQFSYLDAVLAKQHFLLGNRFSVADAYLFTVLRWAIAMQFDLKKHAQLSAYFDRVAARPSVEATLNAEGLK
ncbi:MAG: glutathione transferase GstA, partial [Serratia liquefaciens]|nr:glutathione transferase GstA [Serratia liquefaciens]